MEHAIISGFSFPAVLLALIFQPLIGGIQSPESMKYVHESTPELTLFLPEAADAMWAYHRLHGRFAAEWWQMEIVFSYEPCRITDPGVKPTRPEGALWKPRACEFSYKIDRATKDEFLILAVAPSGKVVARMSEKLKVPELLPNR